MTLAFTWAFTRARLAYMIGSLEREWKGGRERMLCLILYQQIKRPLEHKVLNIEVFFLFVLLHTQFLIPRWQGDL